MCGITGILTENSKESLSAICTAMTVSLKHRGPDDHDVWSEDGVALGHARLSIVDLSNAGHQPMLSSDGRWVLVYNGEIYNHKEIKKELESSGVRFCGHSDTEVVVEGIAAWGIEATVKKLNGMFAFALWDKKEKNLHLVRDRLGIKPLYWGCFGGLFLFGSELKALRAHPGWQPKVNRNAISGFMRHNYISAPMSIYEGVYKLSPGSILTIRAGKEPRIDPYWSLSDVAQEGQKNEFDYTDSEAIEALDSLLRDAVGRRMVADVPLGAFLSGGIDSSTVVALMQAQSSRPVHTYTIGFHESGFNEAQHAAAVAKHLGTEHTELYVNSRDAQDVIPKLAEIYDEPFADSSQIPAYLVSAMTRQHVTVALSGDGGDECFSGYSRYFLAERIRQSQRFVPKSLRSVAASLVCSISPKYLDRLSGILPASIRPSQFGDRLHKLAGVLSEGEDDFYRKLISHWDDPESIVLDGKESKGIIWDSSVCDIVPEFVNRMRYLDMLTYLPDDILTKVDRASMAVSLEARVPLLDHRVVEFSWRLPKHFKIREGKGKWLLRQVLSQYIPKELVERPKMGFGVPIGDWLKDPLREWAEELLDEKKMKEEGYFNVEAIRQKWNEHLSGSRNWQYHLWDVLMFQAWQHRWFKV